MLASKPNETAFDINEAELIAEKIRKAYCKKDNFPIDPVTLGRELGIKIIDVKLPHKDKESDRELKRNYAYWFIGILIAQLIVMNAVFIIVGLGYLKFDAHVLEIYMAVTLAEVFGVIVVITKNLFPKKHN
ncbi:MAG: hypothetical protein WAX77_02020 [Methylococcaceae bacterium]